MIYSNLTRTFNVGELLMAVDCPVLSWQFSFVGQTTCRLDATVVVPPTHADSTAHRGAAEGRAKVHWKECDNSCDTCAQWKFRCASSLLMLPKPTMLMPTLWWPTPPTWICICFATLAFETSKSKLHIFPPERLKAHIHGDIIYLRQFPGRRW